MEDGRQAVDGIDRRGVLGLLGGTTASIVGFSGTVAADPPKQPGKPYRLVQGERCIEVTPLQGSETAAEFYDWNAAETLYSSQATADLQRPDTSQLFLYEAPDGAVSLVIIHGKFGGSHDGGSASLTFHGLPEDGTWQTRDDFYDEPTNYDVWRSGEVDAVDWTWDGGRTDGGVYGPLGGHFEIEIEPAFNQDAALYEEYYDGEITEWQVLSGDLDDPDRITIDMDRPIRLEVGPCEPIDNRREHDDADDNDESENHGRDSDDENDGDDRNEEGTESEDTDDSGEDAEENANDDSGTEDGDDDADSEDREDEDGESDDDERNSPSGRGDDPPGRGKPPWANGE